jgi:hypothetical protein
MRAGFVQRAQADQLPANGFDLGVEKNHGEKLLVGLMQRRGFDGVDPILHEPARRVAHDRINNGFTNRLDGELAKGIADSALHGPWASSARLLVSHHFERHLMAALAGCCAGSLDQ